MSAGCFRLLSCLLFLSTVLGSRPVKDFRVSDIGSFGSKSLTSKSKHIVKDLAVAVTSSVPSSAPTIELSSDVQMISTDSSKSILYLNVSVIDSTTSYNKSFSLLFDTGSANSWIYNESCSTDACNGVNVFNDYNGNSIQSSSSFQLSYSGDIVKGSLIDAGKNNLEVTIGSLALSNFSFGLSESSPEMYDDYAVSGIIGIPSSYESNRNIIHQLYSAGLIDKQIFGISLIYDDQTIKYIDEYNNSADLPSEYGGILFLGSNADKYSETMSSEIYYADIIDNENSYWLINITSVGLTNDTSSQPLDDSSRQAIIDTGTTGLALPLEDANKLHEQLFGSKLVTDNQGNYAFFCNQTDFVISFEINGHTLNLTSSDFIASKYSGNGLDGYCASKIQGISTIDDWVLGAAFLGQFYTIFDLESGKLGFGDSKINAYTIKEEGPESIDTTHSYSVTNSSSSSTSSSASKSTSKSTSITSSSTLSKSTTSPSASSAQSSSSSSASSTASSSGSTNSLASLKAHCTIAVTALCIIIFMSST